MANVAKTATASQFFLPFTPDRALSPVTTPDMRWVAWQPHQAGQSSIIVDLGKEYLISGYSISDMTVCAPTDGNQRWTAPDYCNQSYTVSFSADGTNFVPQDKVQNPQGTYKKTVPCATPYRYVKIDVQPIALSRRIASLSNVQVFDAVLLSNLVVSGCSITPAFSQSTINYSADAIVDTISITPSTANGDDYNIFVNSTACVSGSSVTVPLKSGENQIAILVRSKLDGGGIAYNLTVTKHTAYLSGLSLQDNAASPDNVALSPEFDGQNVLHYSANAVYDTQGTGAASTAIKVTPVAGINGETITVNGNTVSSGSASNLISLSAGGVTTIKVVSKENGNEDQEYDVDVTMASSPYLQSLGNKAVPFVKATLSYNITYSGTSFPMQPVSEDNNAAITVTTPEGTQTYSSGQRILAPLTVGQTTNVTIKVASSKGSDSRTYLLAISN